MRAASDEISVVMPGMWSRICWTIVELNGVLLTEMDAVEQFMAMHPANLYLSRNEMTVNASVTVPKLMTIIASIFLRMA